MGPSPSCRSRRSRRRSSSRVVTRPARDASSARRSATAWAAGPACRARSASSRSSSGPSCSPRDRVPTRSRPTVSRWKVRRERDHLRRGLAVRGGRAPPVAEPQLERRVREPQAVRDGLDHRAERGFGVGRFLDPAAEPGQGLVGHAPVAVEQPVHPALHPVVQRPQRAGGQHGRDDLHGQAAALQAEDRTERLGGHDHGQVDPGHPRGQHAVQHRPVQQDVDLVEPVPQDRDPDRDGHQDAAPAAPGPGSTCPGRPGWRSARRW